MLITVSLPCPKLTWSSLCLNRKPDLLYPVATTQGGDGLSAPSHGTGLVCSGSVVFLSPHHPRFWTETLQWLVCVGGIYTFLIWPEKQALKCILVHPGQ